MHTPKGIKIPQKGPPKLWKRQKHKILDFLILLKIVFVSGPTLPLSVAPPARNSFLWRQRKQAGTESLRDRWRLAGMGVLDLGLELKMTCRQLLKPIRCCSIWCYRRRCLRLLTSFVFSPETVIEHLCGNAGPCCGAFS